MIPGADRQFGEFGEGVQPIHQTRKKKSFFRKFLLVLFLISLPVAWIVYNRFYLKFFESDPPSIKIISTAGGVGVQEIDIKVRVHDAGAGLDEVVFKADQGARPVVLDKFKVQQGGSASSQPKEYTVSIDGRKLGFHPGDLRIIVAAYDKSFWSNKFVQEINLKVDYDAPQVWPITTQHNAVHGGVQLVIYKVKDGKNKKYKGLSGIQMGQWLFPGFPAEDLDPDFKGQTNLFFTFFPVPFSFNPDEKKIRLFARDDVGNFGTSSFHYTVRKIKPKKRRYKVSQEILKKAGTKFYKKYVSDKKDYTKPSSEEDIVNRYKAVNEDYRKEIEKVLVPLISKPKTKKFWKNKFAKFKGFTYIYNFNEIQEYSYKKLDAGTVLSTGTGFYNSANNTVRATNDGIVIFADSLGLKGNTVIIDHGLGLSTHYSNLEKAEVQEGTQVERGDVLGVTGNTGLYKDKLLHYEVRMHGVPVRPEEWWDERWVKGHILKKLKNAKRDLRIKVMKKLE